MREESLLQSWCRDLSGSTEHNQADHPNYYATTPTSLTTTCNITSLTFGTGYGIYKTIRPALESVSSEIILVTCFWARSRTLNTFNDVLCHLSAKAQQKGRKIRVRIYFSSSSLLQKIFHTFSPNGQIYAPSSWPSKFGLPSVETLPGLDMEIKSIFFLPFCVMHPKFIICDRKKVFLPSCNVSWEDWFEGCVGMTGPVVEQFLNFWSQVWATPADKAYHFPIQEVIETSSSEPFLSAQRSEAKDNTSPASQESDEPMLNRSLPAACQLDLKDVKTIFLPSPHHINPRFRFPWQDYAPAPPTPLNTFLLLAIAEARSSIYIQTPNITSPPVLSAILEALDKNPYLHVHIVTSARLMILEQLVTGGSTTSRCIAALIRAHSRLRESSKIDIESAPQGVGHLKVEFYEPWRNTSSGAVSDQDQGQRSVTASAEPVQSHLKCTVVDDELVVLGSGNLDRASWYTSQELGVAFFSAELALLVGDTLARVLQGRKRCIYDS